MLKNKQDNYLNLHITDSSEVKDCYAKNFYNSFFFYNYYFQ